MSIFAETNPSEYKTVPNQRPPFKKRMIDVFIGIDSVDRVLITVMSAARGENANNTLPPAATIPKIVRAADGSAKNSTDPIKKRRPAQKRY